MPLKVFPSPPDLSKMSSQTSFESSGRTATMSTEIVSKRPVRSTRIKADPPVLPQIIARINDLNGKYYENILNEFNAISKYFKDDHDMITSFWLTHYEYNLTDFKHRYLLRRLFETVGFKKPLVKSMLDNIDDKEILSQLGVVRVSNGDKVFYRIRVGTEAD